MYNKSNTSNNKNLKEYASPQFKLAVKSIAIEDYCHNEISNNSDHPVINKVSEKEIRNYLNQKILGEEN